MDYELKERITQIRNALTLIWNVHQSEFTFYEGIKMNEAYWALVDILDKRRAKEFEDAGKEVDELLKKEMNEKEVCKHCVHFRPDENFCAFTNRTLTEWEINNDSGICFYPKEQEK